MLHGQRVVTGLGVLMCLTSASAAGQQADTTTASRAGSALGFAAKVGVGFEPSQFVVGLQYSLGKTLGLFRLVPNGHAGFGDVTTFDFSLDFLLRGVLDSGLGIYGGAAPTLAFWEDNTDVGATLVGGIQLPLLKDRATNLEARFGIGDIPEFRLLGVIVF
jgi:hypothetical protein